MRSSKTIVVIAGGVVLGGFAWLALHPRAPRTGVAPNHERAHDEARRGLERPRGASDERSATARAESGDGQANDAPSRAGADPTTLSGVVLGPDGTPPRWASVLFAWKSGDELRTESTRASQDGRFALALEEVDPVDPVRGDLIAFTYGHDLVPTVVEGIEGGARDLQLRLGAPSFLTVEVVDPEGQPIVNATRTFAWQLAGGRVSATRRGYGLEESPHWTRSPVPWFVDVSAAGYQPRSFGPFAPSDSPAPLVLEPYPRVRGTVTHDGAPVARASVRMAPVGDGPSPAKPGWSALGWYATTDELGRFETWYSEPMSVAITAHALPEGSGRTATIVLDGTDRDGLTVALTEAPGAIEGRVILPNGRAPEEIWLWPDGSPGYRDLRPDGSFVLPDLFAGTRRIQVVGGCALESAGTEYFGLSDGPTSGPAWLAYERVFEAEVVPGRTTRLDIDLAGPMRYELEGVVRLDGAVPRRRAAEDTTWDASPFDARLLHGGLWPLDSATTIDGEGRFLLGVDVPRERRLSLEIGLADADALTWSIEEAVAFAGARTLWRFDVATGELVVRGRSKRALRHSRATVVREGPGTRRIQVAGPAIDEEACALVFRRVPAGAVRVVLWNGSEHEEIPAEVRAGETTVVDWLR